MSIGAASAVAVHGQRRSSPTIWLVDPISYSGMAYSDVGQIAALAELGARPLLMGSDSWMLDPDLVARVSVFRGTHGDRSRTRKGIAYVVSLARLLKRARIVRPDIIHWQYTELPVADLLTMLAIRTMGICQVYTAHELVPWKARAHHRWLFSRLYGLMDAIVVHNDAQKAELVRGFGTRESSVHVAPLGDYALFADPFLPQERARADIGVRAEASVALFFGTIRLAKGLEVLLRAWPDVKARVPSAQLLIVGKPFEGMDPAKIRALIDGFGVADSVRTVLEQVDPATANSYYGAADIVVLPYHTIGTSGVLRYAYNSARPVVASAVGEHTTHVIPGETGSLVPPGDATALAEAMIEALSDRPRMQSMGRAARSYASANFAWLPTGRLLLDVYAGVLSGKADRRA